jgi:hypothetical protein
MGPKSLEAKLIYSIINESKHNILALAGKGNNKI